MTTLNTLNSDMGEILLTSLKTPAQDCSITMPVVSGKSAYDLAVENGYVGDLDAWLASIKGWQPVTSEEYLNLLNGELEKSPLLAELRTGINASNEAIKAEIQARISAINAMHNELIAEAKQRVSDMQAYSAQLLSETQNRIADIKSVRDQLVSESDARSLEAQQLVNDILAEQVTRVAEINNTIELINNEVSIRSAEIDKLSNDLLAEQSERQSALVDVIASIDALDSKANTNHTFILNNYSTTSTTNSEIASQINALKTTYVIPELNKKATVTALDTTNTNISNINGTLNVMGTKLDGVYATVTPDYAGNSGSLSGTSETQAGTWTVQSAIIEGDVAVSQRLENLIATNQLDTDARIVTEQKARVDADSALTSSITTMSTRVGTAEGKITSLEKVTTDTNSSLSQVSTKLDNLVITVGGKASSQALTDLSSKVTTAEGNITSQGQAITKLTNDLATTNNTVNTKASAESLTALTNRVTSTEGTITSHSEDITALENSVSGINNDLATKASSQAVTDLTSRVTTAEGKITSNASNITALNTSVNTKNRTYRQTSAPTTGLVVGDLWINTTTNMNNETKRWNGTSWDILTDPRVSANSSAISTLQSTTTTQGNTITAQGQAINTLQSDMESVSNGLSSKADSTAVSGLTNRVTATEGKITTNSDAITALAGRVTTTENNLTTKADASALNDYYTKVKADEAIAGEITKFNGKLRIGNENLITKAKWRSPAFNTVIQTDKYEFKLVKATSPYQAWAQFGTWAEIPLNENLVFSFKIKALDTTPLSVGGHTSGISSGGSVYLDGVLVVGASFFGGTAVVIPNDDKYHLVTVFLTRNNTTTDSIYIQPNRATGYNNPVNCSVKEVMLSYGNTYVEWVAPNEFIQDQLNANATAISGLTTRVSNAEGTITSQGTSITNLNNSVSTAQNTADAKGKVIYSNTAPAVADQLPQNLWIDTTSNYNTPKRWNGSAWLAVTDKVALDALTQANTNKDAITTKADASAVSTLANRVTTAEGNITSNSNSITTLNNNLSTLTNTVNTKADSSALSSLDSKVTSLEGTVTSQGSSITTLNNSLTTTNNNVTAKGKVIYGTTAPVTADQLTQNLWIDTTNNANTPKRWNGTAWVVISDKAATDALAAANQANSTLTTKADSSALNSLTTRVNTAEGNITSQGTAISNLQNSVSTINGTLSNKADSSALTTLDNKVTSIDGKVTTNTNSITSLQGNVTTINNNLATKADASALSNYYTKAQADSAISGKVDEFKSTYSESVLPTDKDTSRVNTWSRIVYSKKAPYIGDNVIPDYSYLVNYKKHSEDYFAEGRTKAVPINNSINYYRAVFTVSSAKVINLGNLTGDDAHAVYIDNVKVHSASSYSTNPCSFSVTAGEHIIDIIVNNGDGNAGFSSTNTLSSQVDSMYAVKLVYKDTELNASAISNTYTKAEADSVTAVKIEEFKTNYVNTELGKKFNASAINSYYNISDTDKAISNQINSLKTDFIVPQLNTKGSAQVLSDLKATVEDATTGLAATATKLDGVFVQVNPDMAGDDVSMAGINTKQAGVWTQMSSSIENDLALSKRIDLLTSAIDENTANITSEQIARASADSAITSSVNTLSTTVNGHTASIQTSQKTIDGLSAQYTVKVDVNGRVAGFGLASTAINGTPTSEFAVLADKFYIASPNSTDKGKSLFQVLNSPTTIDNISIPAGVYMDGAFIRYASIDTAHIRNGAIVSAKIFDAAIVSAKIADGNITTAKIGDLQVSNAKIANLAVDSLKLADLAVTNAKIANATITDAKIANLDAAKITTGYLSADRIDANTITGDKIKANTEINAPKIKGGEININENFKVDSQGNLTARSGTFEGTVLANKISGTIDVESLKNSAWMGGFIAKFYSYINGTTTPITNTALIPSRGSIIQQYSDFMAIEKVIYTIEVTVLNSTSISYSIMRVDDAIEIVVYKDNIQYSYVKHPAYFNSDYNLYLPSGNIKIEYRLLNSSNGDCGVVLLGDFIDNVNIKYR